jgi:hypothetical protein
MDFPVRPIGADPDASIHCQIQAGKIFVPHVPTKKISRKFSGHVLHDGRRHQPGRVSHSLAVCHIPMKYFVSVEV